MARARSKYADSSSRTASGSRDSDSGVNPTRSANSSETTRRSETGSTGGAVGLGVAESAGGVAPPADGASGVPHSLQNLPSAGAPQLGQTALTAAPHSEQ